MNEGLFNLLVKNGINVDSLADSREQKTRALARAIKAFQNYGAELIIEHKYSFFQGYLVGTIIFSNMPDYSVDGEPFICTLLKSLNSWNNQCEEIVVLIVELGLILGGIDHSANLSLKGQDGQNATDLINKNAALQQYLAEMASTPSAA